MFKYDVHCQQKYMQMRGMVVSGKSKDCKDSITEN